MTKLYYLIYNYLMLFKHKKYSRISRLKNKHMNGTIKTLREDRGFGFIAREGEAKDLFFHANELNGVAFEELKVGDAVTFEVVEGDKGPSAKNVSRA